MDDACTAGTGSVCWLCEGRDSAACVICGPPSVAQTCGQTSTLVGQDGWCCDDSRDERFGNWTYSSVEDINLQLLSDSEALLRQGDASGSFERAEQCSRGMEERLSEGRGGRLDFQAAAAKPGELEMLCLGQVQRIRSSLAQQNYPRVVEDTKKFSKLHEEIVSGGAPDILHKFEKQVTGALVVDHIEVLGAAAELAIQCRDRVARGYAPKTVLDHASKAVTGLQPLPANDFPGLGFLRAHLHVSRAQAYLELELWEQAKEDASAAMRCDPSVPEARYLLKAAECESW
ncbi:unnamed protein product [Symbiodinium natans]|uniref:Uncharacterized protein n=1 Tax=Symbiodinium natans TaxID=878477 RepID=A0A812T3U0_9DINO|nr:unnamed protein product [Symbiodinium natans]